MKNAYKTMLKRLLVIGMMVGGSLVSAATFDWSTVGWSGGELAQSYTDVDGSGIDIDVTVTGDTDRLGDGSPKIDSNYFYLDANYQNDTQSVIVTFKFSTPVKLSNLKWMDIDSDPRLWGSSNFDDRIIVSVKDSDDNAVVISSESYGSAITRNSAGDYESDNSQGYTLNDPEAQVDLNYTDDYIVTELSFEYTNGSYVRSNPKEQAIWFDNFDFEAVDTDGDGVFDVKDIDDDNDGILDSVEIQGGGNCAYGFFHMIGGVLNVFDPENEVYLPIGEKHKSINAMGFDDQTGRLYASIRKDTTDDYGTSLAKNDVIEIDRYSGKIKKANTINSSTVDSFAADFYNGALYARKDTSKLYKWIKSDDTLSDIVFTSGSENAADFAIDDSSGTIMAYGLRTTNQTSGDTDNTKLYQINISNNTSTNVKLTVTTPDGADLSKGWGATFMAKDDAGNRHFYATNNNGYIYEIIDYDTTAPTATFVYRSVSTGNNDGASCRDANQYAVDTDGDGIKDYLDLDSDNDGIPDNVEAQPTTGYDAPDSTWTDVDGDGLADQYDDDTSGVAGSNGLIPPDKDGDNTADFLDNDSDNDGYGDCEEGQDPNHVNRSCSSDGKTVSGTIQSNGMVDWAGSAGYSDTNGNVDDPTTDLVNETGDASEVAYREFLCGKGRIYLTAYNWRLISLPCDTGTNELQDVFSQLGTYNSNFVVYKQTGDDNYEVNASHKNTNKIKLGASSILEQGISYWIITDADHNVTIDEENLTGLSPTTTEDANSSSVSIDNQNFDKVAQFQLPTNSDANDKKYMSGNPFPYGFDMSNLYFKHASSGATFNPMGSSNNDAFINTIVYKHDSPDTSDKNVTDGGGYEAVVPSTPGFHAPIQPMEGFFIKLETNSDTTSGNSFAYPLTYSNDN